MPNAVSQQRPALLCHIECRQGLNTPGFGPRLRRGLGRASGAAIGYDWFNVGIGAPCATPHTTGVLYIAAPVLSASAGWGYFSERGRAAWRFSASPPCEDR